MAKSSKSHYAVEWAATAKSDLDEIVDYLLERDPINAMKVLDAIEASAKSLGLLPLRGRIVPELKFHGVTAYRERVIGPWRLLYRIGENTVWVVSLVDGRRQLDDLLLERFLRS